MATLEAAMKKHHIILDSSSESTSQGHALWLLVILMLHLLLLLQMNGSLILEHLIIWLRIKPYFFTMHECNTKQIFVGDDRSLSVVGFGTVPVENGHFSDVLCVPKISCNLLSVYQITHSGKGKTVTFTPHQVVIKDFKNPQNILATGTVDDITRLYKFNNFGHHLFLYFLLLIVIT